MSACFAVPRETARDVVCVFGFELEHGRKRRRKKRENQNGMKERNHSKRMTCTSVRVRSGWKLKRYVPTTEWIISIRNAVEEGKEIFLFVLSRQDIQLIPFVIPFKIFLYF